jgi:hypothetical protein
MCGSVEEKAFNTNMKFMGVIDSERNTIRKRRVWKRLGLDGHEFSSAPSHA